MRAHYFLDPPADYRPVAMWFLNGSIDEEEARRQIRAMASGGLGAIQVAARSGLRTPPYLSQRWFDLIALVLDEAQSHGLRVWLADEYPYPSGTSGGEVILRHPQYRAWQMQATRLRAAAGEEVCAVAPGTVLLRACGVPLLQDRPQWTDAVQLEANVGLLQHQHVLFEPTQVYLTNRRYMTNAPRPTLSWRAPAGGPDWEIWLIAASEISDYKFFGSYVDLCNREAIDYFLTTTYERYLARLGAERFSQLAGFFLDEAHPQNWSWQLPDFFRQSRGYDLIEVLPALWTDIGPQTARVRYDYRQSITELFDRNFMRPVAEWCRQHDASLSLEVPSTRNVVQRHATLPGIDPGHDKVGVPLDDILSRELPSFRGNLNFPASLAAQTRRRRVLDELFHSTGWSLTLQDMKAMLDRAAARGANLFAFHAFCYTTGGLRKWDAPPSEFDQNPYWPHFPLLSKYAGRLAYALSRGRRVAPIAVVDPITSFWAHSALPGLQPDDLARRVNEDWMRLMRELAACQRPYDNLDAMLLSEATVNDSRLRIEEAEYRVIVLPSVTNLEQAAWNKLQEFVDKGGTVVASGLLPVEEIEQPGDVVERSRAVFQTGTREGFVQVASVQELLDVLDERVPLDLLLMPEGGEAARRQFLLTQRREADLDIFFIANSTMDMVSCDILIRAGDRAVTRLDLETGRSGRLECHPVGDGTHLQVRLDFACHGAQLLLLGPPLPTAESEPRETRGTPVLDFRMDGDWRCEIADGGMNILRLDRFRFTLTGENTADMLEYATNLLTQTGCPIVEPKPLVNIFGNVAANGAQWPGTIAVTPIFGAPPRMHLGLPSTAWYMATFDVASVPERAVLCLEDLALSGEWRVWMNGRSITRDAFVARRRWSNDTREANVAPLLVQGNNQLVLRVIASEAWDGLLDAVYVLGDFGVFSVDDDTPLLAHQPENMSWPERHTSGYPYFSGTLRLTRRSAHTFPSGAFRLQLPDNELMFAGVVELAINGHQLGVRAWAPYAWDVPSGLVSSGLDTEIALSITNTLIEQLEGKRYDPNLRRVVSVW